MKRWREGVNRGRLDHRHPLRGEKGGEGGGREVEGRDEGEMVCATREKWGGRQVEGYKDGEIKNMVKRARSRGSGR